MDVHGAIKPTTKKRSKPNTKKQAEAEQIRVSRTIGTDDIDLDLAFPDSVALPVPDMSPDELWRLHLVDLDEQRAVYGQQKHALIRQHPGKWTAFVGGKNCGFFNSGKEAQFKASELASKEKRAAYYVTRIGYEDEEER